MSYGFFLCFCYYFFVRFLEVVLCISVYVIGSYINDQLNVCDDKIDGENQQLYIGKDKSGGVVFEMSNFFFYSKFGQVEGIYDDFL